MTGKQNFGGQAAAKTKNTRAGRLKAALRANLKRRKQQASGRAAAEQAAAPAKREAAGD